MEQEALRDSVALVTGGASGIGRAAARSLAAEGAAVAVLDRDETGAKRVASEIEGQGGSAGAFRVDLAQTDAIPEAVAAVLERFGRIDLLINCAGTFGGGEALLDLTEAGWDLVQTVNLKAPFLLMQQVAKHMVERGGGGRIVNVSSSSAFRAPQSAIAYGSSKAGLVQLTRSAAAELAPHGINVNAVAPGVTATGMTAEIDSDAQNAAVTIGPLANLFGRVSQPEDVAAAILFLCLPSSRQITAQTLHTSAGAVV